MCNWETHLFTLSRILSLFGASGHIHYAKSARLYFQLMQEYKQNIPGFILNLCKVIKLLAVLNYTSLAYDQMYSLSKF